MWESLADTGRASLNAASVCESLVVSSLVFLVIPTEDLGPGGGTCGLLAVAAHE